MDELPRLFMLYVHLVAFAVTLSAVFIEDVRMVVTLRWMKWPTGQPLQLDQKRLQITADIALTGLCVLAASGLAIVAIDTSLDPAIMLSKPKLMAKLSVILILLANGVALHFYGFPALFRPTSHPARTATILCVLGAISSASWFYASFLGIAKPLTSILSYEGFMSAYAVCIVGAFIASTLLTWKPMMRLVALNSLPMERSQRSSASTTNGQKTKCGDGLLAH